MKPEIPVSDLLLWKHYCTDSQQCYRFKRLICKKCKHTFSANEGGHEYASCKLTRLEDGHVRLWSAFHCIDHGTFTPRSPKTNPITVQKEICEFVKKEFRARDRETAEAVMDYLREHDYRGTEAGVCETDMQASDDDQGTVDSE